MKPATLHGVTFISLLLLAAAACDNEPSNAPDAKRQPESDQAPVGKTPTPPPTAPQTISRTGPPAAPPANQAEKDLLEAAEKGDLENAKSLLDAGANINVTDHQKATPLHRAARHENKDMMELLLSKGADVNHADSSGQTALMWAGNRRNWELVKWLLEKGAAPRVGVSPLIFAIQSGQGEIVKLLIEKGVEVNPEKGGPMTPLKVARGFGHKDIERMLIEAGAKD